MEDLFKNKYRISSNRMRNWDYAGNGHYFITSVTAFRQELFGEIVNNEMVLNDFGKIVLSADGQVYANINQLPIGNMQESLSEMLCRELDSNKAWLRTRYHVEPCKDCRFKLICPSLTGLEDIIERNNLCHIK